MNHSKGIPTKEKKTHLYIDSKMRIQDYYLRSQPKAAEWGLNENMVGVAIVHMIRVLFVRSRQETGMKVLEGNYCDKTGQIGVIRLPGYYGFTTSADYIFVIL